jgi:hypothetical protein
MVLVDQGNLRRKGLMGRYMGWMGHYMASHLMQVSIVLGELFLLLVLILVMQSYP